MISPEENFEHELSAVRKHSSTQVPSNELSPIGFRYSFAALEWMEDAACKGMTHLFFPPKGERPQGKQRREAAARQVCSSCVVKRTCRDYARDNDEKGFWGGESDDDRVPSTGVVPLGSYLTRKGIQAQRLLRDETNKSSE